MPRLAVHRLQDWWRAQRSGFPTYAEKYGADDLVRSIGRATTEFAPDAIQVEYLQLALVLRHLRAWRDGRPRGAAPGGSDRPRLVLNTHELGSVPRHRRARLTRGFLRRQLLRREARRWEHLQVCATQWADVTLCVTAGDRVNLAALGGRNLVTVPLGMDTERIQAHYPESTGPRYLFLGSFAHRPNRVAAERLLARHWPAVTERIAGAELVLAGRGSREFIAALPAAAHRRTARVVALGFVEDLAGLLRECVALVAPLTEGGGIKIKILEAMARGLPVVTTPIGAEGIVAAEDGAAWIADDDAAFTEAMLDVARRPVEARRRAERARQRIEEHFSWSAIATRLTRIYEDGIATEGPVASREGT
jgi:glycosyltransferase involved in cell wall biosynthesis